MKLGALYAATPAPRRCLVPQVWKAATAWERARGLLGRPPLQPGQALLIEPCASVHTIGMAYPLDLAFIDRHGVVKKLVRGLRPLRFAAGAGARATLEMPPGALDACGLCEGDSVLWAET